ncbi:serine/threonine-protein kinase [Marinifilum sp. D714]|uniref:serine/threonine-protein kinase n=1 Tax=Marinifilum sp. D714 TaxID=2937523 RepID=UPI0027BD2DBB|nr:serine/threonine-protein kinase [Marinifilum sp. D714]MDQ2180820.1 serine/threonine protein kinase [Marinifilum sp. D714]
MPIVSLTREFLEHFNITECSRAICGGQKTVYKVRIDGKFYALKVIKVADERFIRELKICEEFKQNAGIPRIFEVKSYDGETVILEEFIDGNDLSQISGQYLGDETKVCRLIKEIIQSLKPVWEARYIHRDLKPANIRIRKNGTPVILDFGIARALDDESITVSGGQPLTYIYGSPEQYAGKKSLISYRTDFFCIGVIAFQLYTGKLPFGNGREEIGLKYKNGNLKVSSGSEKIDIFCNAVFKVNPSERPRTIDSLIKLI